MYKREYQTNVEDAKSLKNSYFEQMMAGNPAADAFMGEMPSYTNNFAYMQEYEEKIQKIINDVYEATLESLQSENSNIPEEQKKTLILLFGTMKNLSEQKVSIKHISEEFNLIRMNMDKYTKDLIALMRENDSLKRQLALPWYKRFFS